MSSKMTTSGVQGLYAVLKLVDDCTTICYHGYRGLENDLICMYMIIMIIVMYCWCLLKVHRRLLILSFWRLFLRFKQNTTKNIAFYLWTFLRNLHSKTHQISPFWFQFFNFSFQLRGEHPPSDSPLVSTAIKNTHEPPLRTILVELSRMRNIPYFMSFYYHYYTGNSRPRFFLPPRLPV